MSRREKVETILGKAQALEKKYDWSKAVDLYEQALDVVGKKDFLRNGEVQERISYCLYRGAFQAETQADFKNRMQKAVEAYEKAAEFYEHVELAKSLYSRARALYANSWIHVDASRKRLVLDDCGRMLKEAMKAFEEGGDQLGYGKACNDLLFCLYDRHNIEWDWTEKRRRLEEAMKHGQNAISTLSKVRDERELARTYAIVGLHSMAAGLGQLGEEHREEFVHTALSYAEKALELSRKTGDEYVISWSNWLKAATQFMLTGNLELSLRYGEECLQQAKKLKDNFLIGSTFWGFSEAVSWITFAEEDPDKKREGYEKVTWYAGESVRHLLTVCRYDYLVMSYRMYIESYFFLAHDVETDPEEKRNLLERAIEVGGKSLEYAKQSQMPAIANVHHSLSKAFYSLSELETQITGKRRLLEEALEHREKNIDITEQAESPFNYWDHGVMQNYAALIKAALAAIETDKEKKKDLLEEAVSHIEGCIELCSKWTAIYPQAKLFTVFARYQDWFGGILSQLYSLTNEEATLENAIKVYQGAAETYRKVELPSRVAEAYWHEARLYDQLGEHTKAERSFQAASEKYRVAAGKIPQLKELYMKQGLYMQAWSEIEKAKQHHVEKQYGQAKKHYEQAANLHKSTDRWKYLNHDYLAWARLEEAEDLSRREQAEEAIELFRQAANLFVEAKKSIHEKLAKIKAKDEKDMAAGLAKASDIRREYCLGRVALEEAKILDRQGDHAASSRKYGFAAEKFRKAIEAMDHDSDRQELRPIVSLSRAWEMMTRAEAEASPDLYREASKLFEETRDQGIDEKAKMLALGHSSFCKALEAGARFEAVRDTALHTLATQHLEGAASYYLRAGFKNASEFAEATQKLLDAYLYMHNAKTETDPVRKARFYMIAEKVLQASAGSYLKAKHPEKQEQVSRLLEKVKRERELALSLTEILHAPLAASTTATFTTPTPTEEKPIGLDQFEHADVQANLLVRVREVTVGEDVDYRMELVNAGKAPALLIKVDEIMPEGFEIKEVPESYAVEDRYLNMKGRRLNPLKTEDVKIVAKPLSKGTFPIKPRVLYIDETGKYKSHEPEPVAIKVKELGIKGWIKGER